jgi:hypothetical protein
MNDTARHASLLHAPTALCVTHKAPVDGFCITSKKCLSKAFLQKIIAAVLKEILCDEN